MDDLHALKMARLEHSDRGKVFPLILFAFIVTLYACLCAAILVSPLWLALILTLPCGLVIGDLFVIGHDACHQSLTCSARLNSVLGRLCFLPSYHSFLLWDLGHNRIHHKYNNIKGRDYVWEPMTVGEYRAASKFERAEYRFFRSALGMPFYYLTKIWFPKMVVPRRSVVGNNVRKYWKDSIYLSAFFAFQVAVIGICAATLQVNFWLSVALVILLPLVVFNMLMSAVIYVHHTHPDVHWYDGISAWKQHNGAVAGTVHVRFPLLLRVAMLEITEHNAHHFAPGVPLYNLSKMQHEMSSHSDAVVSYDFSIPALLKILNRCKLYDFDAKRWQKYPVARASHDTSLQAEEKVVDYRPFS